MQRAWSHLLLVLSLMAGWAGHAQAMEASSPVDEYTLKVAYLYNFALLTSWPPKSNNTDVLTLCVYGSNDALRLSLQQLNDRLVGNQRIQIHTLRNSIELGQCHVLYVAETQPDRLLPLQLTLSKSTQALLTIADDDVPSASFACIQLEMRNNRIGFSINLKAAKTAQLQLNSRLLRLATRIDN